MNFMQNLNSNFFFSLFEKLQVLTYDLGIVANAEDKTLYIMLNDMMCEHLRESQK